MPSFLVVSFSVDKLNEVLSNKHASPVEVATFSPVKYLYGYLKDLGANTIVVEDPYTDGDFLDDYTAYYARCFSSYGRRCKRLHFFRRDFTDESLRDLLRRSLTQDEKESLQADYLGFVVARPLPQTIIGRSVLRTYDQDGRRQFPVTREYTANFFGIELYVQGLAFQEQDTVLAACATVSLWSAFHKAADLFGTAIPTPAVITRAATQAEHYGRPIPQHGLRVEEICSAIRHDGLEPEVVDLQRTPDVPLASLLYGYLRTGLPVVLVVVVPKRGWHAITLTGFSMRGPSQWRQEVPGNTEIVPMVGMCIEKFYGHDDQIGPNARLVIQNSPAGVSPVSTKCPIKFESSWKDPDGEPFLYPVAVVVPVYNKIRLTFLDLQSWIAPLHAVFAAILPKEFRLEWDVHLVFSNEFKKRVKEDSNLAEGVRESLLLTHQPRFWWRAAFTCADLEFCDLLFDATRIARSFPLSAILWRVENFAVQIAKLIEDPTAAAAMRRMLRSDRYIAFLKQSIDLRGRPGELLESHLAS
jgi:hypothetical protein